jgi:toxin ParE1/3/4
MARRIIWSRGASDDIDEIAAYIARDSIRYASKIVDRIIAAAERAASFPNSGRAVPELSDEKIREMIVYNYRIIYRIVTNEIYIAAIIHGARDLEKAMRDRPV